MLFFKSDLGAPLGLLATGFHEVGLVLLLADWDVSLGSVFVELSVAEFALSSVVHVDRWVVRRIKV